MTIKEMEYRLGMNRANIRFYESEGMLFPARNQQGFRDYSLEDEAILKKIKLLRSLHVSLSDIKEIQNGQKELIQVLNAQIREIHSKQQNLNEALQIIEYLKVNNENFEHLNAQPYLEQLDKSNHAYFNQKLDTLPEINALWQRFFARSIDFGLYQLLYFVLFNKVLHFNTSNYSLADLLFSTIFILIFTMLFEPMCLHFFKTTFGKWLFALTVSDKDGYSLTYADALKRTWCVLVYGYGFGIPIYSWIRLYISSKLYNQQEILQWDETCHVTIKDTRAFRYASLPVLFLTRIAVAFFVAMSCFLPTHRGQISTREFVENRNNLAEFHSINENAHLNEEGNFSSNWVSQSYEDPFFLENHPTIQFIEEEGELKCISFSIQKRNVEFMLEGYGNEMQLMILAFVGAQKETTTLTLLQSNLLDIVEKQQNEGFEFTISNVEVSCIVKQTGLSNQGSFLYSEKEGDNSFDLKFMMIKN